MSVTREVTTVTAMPHVLMQSEDSAVSVTVD